jgi:hypothetical protein
LNRHEASKDGEATDSSDIRHRIEALRLALISGLRNEPAAGRRPGGYARAGGHTPAPGGSTGIRPATRIGIEEIENSREIICDHGKCLLVEREIDGSLGISSLNDTRLLETYRDLMAAGPEASPGPGGGPEAGVIFLDLETTGFCATPLFLAGVLIHRGGKLRVVQMLARDCSTSIFFTTRGGDGSTSYRIVDFSPWNGLSLAGGEWVTSVAGKCLAFTMSLCILRTQADSSKC